MTWWKRLLLFLVGNAPSLKRYDEAGSGRSGMAARCASQGPIGQPGRMPRTRHVDARTVIGVVLQNRRRWVVRAFVFACVAALAIAVIGAFVLGGIQESADQALN
jgi:hypothetical protein